MTYFKNIGKIAYEGKGSTNPFAFKHYNPKEVVLGKTMEEHLRFAVAYWHTFTGWRCRPVRCRHSSPRLGSAPTRMDQAKARVEANFEFLEKIGIPYYCFHDRDIAPEGKSLQETNKNLDEIVASDQR